MLIQPVVVGNVGDNSVSSYRLYASDLKHNSWPTPHLRGVARGQPSTEWQADLQHVLATQRLRDRHRRLRCAQCCRQLRTSVNVVRGVIRHHPHLLHYPVPQSLPRYLHPVTSTFEYLKLTARHMLLACLSCTKSFYVFSRCVVTLQ